jgi:D-alanyl-lipoteichoic acid acyltransferase DltB (MBOAT superfamily)
MKVDISFFILPFLLFPFRYFLSQKSWKSLLTITSLLLISYYSVWSAILTFVLSFIVFTVGLKFYKLKWLMIILIVLGFVIIKTKSNGIVILGYAYYSLQLISILLSPQKNIKFVDIILGTTFFPRFFSGPILKNNQLIFSNNLIKDFSEGIVRFVLGICKIFILSNRLDDMLSGYFDHSTQINNGLIVLLSSLLFTVQMYINFSGFTDIALGLGRILGIKLPENFNLPLRSKNVSEYWRKTHITLINWFTQFVFYPIVYQLKLYPKAALIIGTFLVFVLSSLWHNFQIGFIIWGGLNAIFIILENFIKLPFKSTQFIGVLYVWVVVSFANFFFKIGDWETLQKSIEVLKNVNFFPENFMADIVAVLGKGGYLEQQYHLIETIVLLILFLIFENKIYSWVTTPQKPILFIVIGMYLLFIFGNFAQSNQFIYLQF